MKKYLFMLLLFPFCVQMEAQIFEGFEEMECNDTSYSFYSNDSCYPKWLNTHGSPDTDGVHNGIQAYEKEKYVHCYLKTVDCDSGGSNNPNYSHGEGIALQYNFVKGQEYTINFAIRYGTGTGNWSLDWVLANDLVEKTGFVPTCIPGGDIVPALPALHQIIPLGGWISGGSDWIPRSITFIANEDFSFLWLRGENINIQNSNYTNDFYLDAFQLIDCAVAEAPSFYTMDEDGNVTSSFCYGEDVRVCINKADIDWTKTTFYIDRQPAGTYYFSRTNQLYHIEAGCYNLSQFIRDRGNLLFQPGYSYSIKMSVYSPQCGWLDYYKTIWVDCCEEGNADFTVDISGEEPTTRDLKVTAIRDYTYYGDDQTFCLSSDEDLDGVYEEVYCADGASFEYTIDNCVPYKITHSIDTPCGMYELSEIIYVDEHCDDCVIEDFSCVRDASGVGYSWDAVPGALYYELGMLLNDPNCPCSNGTFVFDFLLTTANNYHYFSGSPCISLRVRPICEDGTIGEWTERLCAGECPVIQPLVNIGDESEVRSALTNQFELKTYPNPFNDDFQIDISGELDKNSNYSIINAEGRLISEGKLHGHNTRIDGSGMKSGIYFVLVRNGSGALFTEKIIKL